MRHANFEIEPILLCDALIIRDVGPWDRHPTITNDAEDVLRRLLESGELRPGQRLFYYDSENNMDEIVVRDGEFAGFKPGPARGR